MTNQSHPITLAVDKSTKFGDYMIREARFAGSYVAMIIKTKNGFIARFAPGYVREHTELDLDAKKIYSANTMNDLKNKMQEVVASGTYK